MINLLPPETKQAYRYAMRNVSLTRWAIASFIGLIGVGLIATYGWLSLHQSTRDYDKQVASATTTLQKERLTQTEAQVEDISNSFKLVVKVLGQEVLFSKLLSQMAAVLPSGANLAGLNITGVQSGGGVDITAAATDYRTATQVQVNLADPTNKIFSKADIVSITQNKNAVDPSHPYQVVLRAQFAQNNPFLFINQKATP